MARKIDKSESEWRAQLTPFEFQVLRQAATERPFLGEYTDTETPGLYRCKGCNTPLFRSETKYHSGCGWPSFFDDLGDVIEIRRDLSHGMIREEILCATCGGHLGHVFPDGPPPTGKRYCVNSVSIVLDPDT